MEDTREIADTLLAGCTVVLNLEGIDVDIAQSYVLRQLLAGANHYLSRLTDRYRMECPPGTSTAAIRCGAIPAPRPHPPCCAA